MSPLLHSLSRAFGIAALVVAALAPAQAPALTPANTPLFLVGNVKPLVMLDISRDQQLYKKAYNDYSDLDGDGTLETTYKHAIDYYGYFDPQKCYVYSAGNMRFEPDPTYVSTDKYCAGQWSGNFLNWAAMARIDTVRKLLYGGMRSRNRTDGDGKGIKDGDAADSTVLERTFLPNDAHSWAKYYDGPDLGKLTPYTQPVTTSTTNSTLSVEPNKDGTNSYFLTVGADFVFKIGHYVLVSANNVPGVYFKGEIVPCKHKVGDEQCGSQEIEIKVAKANQAGSLTHDSWTLDNLSRRGITMCNTTLGGASPQDKSETNTNLPRIRVARGNFSLWSANQRWQCLWSEEEDKKFHVTGGSGNGNNFAASAIPAAPNDPGLATDGTGTGLGDYFVRVQACVTGHIGTERCHQYDKITKPYRFKPIGLLQVYGDPDLINFGLVTGSYEKNTSGGVVRKNVGTFTDEVKADGTFNASVAGIVATLDRLRIYGYVYGDPNNINGYDGTYVEGDACGFGLTSIVDGMCTSWGNPMAELHFESLRYLTATKADVAKKPLYSYTNTGSRDDALGLKQPAWTVAVDKTNYCASLNTLVFNASVSTNDYFDFFNKSMTDINGSGTAAALADTVGTGEGIAGKSYFVGDNRSNTDQLCDAKKVENLGKALGICPEGPSLAGSYLMPGIAYQAHTNPIRTDLPTTDPRWLTVTTYGIQLATNVPRIPITLAGETTPRAILQPAFRLNQSAIAVGGGTLVEMQVLAGASTADTASGSIYVNWDDSEQGGDYDQDMWGIVKYCLTTKDQGCGENTKADTLTISTEAIASSTNLRAGFGYVISGTKQNGAHFHSGINDFDFSDTTGVTGCDKCNLGKPGATIWTYDLGKDGAGDWLQDPLFYAAKWGGFNDIDGNKKPSSVQEWDADGNGIPDNYFFVTNPLGLESALNAAFVKILANASASAVATNSSALNSGIRIYQGRFNSGFWTGQLLSYLLDPTTGAVISAPNKPYEDWTEVPYPEWDSGWEIGKQVFPNEDKRLILTRGKGDIGVNFDYDMLSDTQKTYLNTDAFPPDPLSEYDQCGVERVQYLRGWSVNELAPNTAKTFECAANPGKQVAKFRARDTTVLGDIIDSNPLFVGPPAAGYADADHDLYYAFSQDFKDRKPMVYVGANDGLLHGFDAADGKEVLGYVPSPVYENLSRLTDSEYRAGNHRYFVDGSGMMADASSKVWPGSGWKTVFIGGLGNGGKGYYALDITDPREFKPASAKNLVLWEFTDADDPDLGWTYNWSPTHLINGQAQQIAKFDNGEWGVIVGNGYGSREGRAMLYGLFFKGEPGVKKTWTRGDDYSRIEVLGDSNNGLSTPVPIDTTGDGVVDFAYAGDLQGNLWRFDLKNWTTTKFPLFAANEPNPPTDPPDPPDPPPSPSTAQPYETITVAPVVSLDPDHPGGVIVLFGTGKYLEDVDNTTNVPVQRYYGIRDVDPTKEIEVKRKELNRVEVRHKTVTLAKGGTQIYRTTVRPCDEHAPTDCLTADKGWYLDLLDPDSRAAKVVTGERVTGLAKLIRGIIFFNTLIPSPEPCKYGGTGYLMALDYLTGKPLAFPVFDANGDGKFDSSDLDIVGKEVGAALGGTTVIMGNASGGAGVGVSSLTSGKLDATNINFGGGTAGRLNWRELVD